VRIENSRRPDARPDCPPWLRERGFVSSHRLALGEPHPAENTQFIGEHSEFNSKPTTFRLREVDTGVCGMEESPQHTLEVCQLFDEEGQRLRNSIQAIELIWPKEKGEFITKEVYHHVQHFTKSDLLAKEQMSRAALQGMRGPLQQRRPPAKRQAD
jgi:gluconate kinase